MIRLYYDYYVLANDFKIASPQIVSCAGAAFNNHAESVCITEYEDVADPDRRYVMHIFWSPKDSTEFFMNGG